jgi:NADPH:quinone reductase
MKMITDRISIIITKKQKSDTFVWELMFTSSLFQTQDMIVQYHLLNAVTSLIDSKKIKTTLTDLLSPINAEIYVGLTRNWSLVERSGRCVAIL